MKYFFLLITACFLSNTALYAQCNADAGPDSTVCTGSSVQLGGTPAGTGAGTLSYSWSPATGLSCTNCPNPILTATANQTYTLTVSSSLGCTDNNSVSISVVPPPTAAFSITGNNNCSNLPIQFTNTSTGSGLSYSWNFGDPASGAQNTSNQTNPTHSYNAVGSGTQNYTVTLVVTNSNGCTASVTHTVTIRPLPGPGLIDPIAGMRNCDGSNFPLTVFDASSTSGNSNYTIQWGDGSPDFNSGTFPGGGVSHTYTTAEIFTLNYTVTGTNGCVETVSYNIANITNPAIGAANPGATTGCGPITLCFPLSNYSSNHPTTFYVVDYGDGSP
jgi:PKD repeat protein